MPLMIIGIDQNNGRSISLEKKRQVVIERNPNPNPSNRTWAFTYMSVRHRRRLSDGLRQSRTRHNLITDT